MKKIITFIFTIFLSNVLFSQTTLSAGDIAIIQYNSDNPAGVEEIKFLALRSMEAGTIINFTDNGWDTTTAPPTFRTTEGTYIWTAPSAVSCGDIVTMSITVGGFNLGTSGDQILAYQGTIASPTFIFAINNDDPIGEWQASATSARDSALPPGLINGENAVAIREVDNVIYSGSLSGSRETILTNICNSTNWNVGSTTTSHNTNNQTFLGVFNSSSIWNGSVWSIAGVPSADYFTAIIDGNYDTSTDGNFKTCNCTVSAGNSLIVNSGGTVTVKDNITNNGAITVNSGGSVVQVSPSGVNTGTDYTVERASTSQSSYHVFTYWSTPIITATFAAVAPSTHLYYSFNASSQDWTLGNATTVMNPGIGYALEGPDSGTYPGIQTASFTGAAFNTGNISVGLMYNSDGDADTDWNLIGNPYPSAISADTFLADNAATLGGTVYFWTHNTIEDGTVNNTEDDYAMYNGTGGTKAITGGVEPDGNIASAQGFFAQALSASTVKFTNSMRIASNNTSFFRSEKKVKNIARDRIWLNLTTTKSFSQILIGFLEEASDNVDRKYDGIRFLGKTSLNFYSILNDAHYGIQGKSNLKEEETIPLGVSSDVSGNFKISIDKVEGNLESSYVYLEDTYLNVKHNLKKADYTFTTLEAGNFNDRFNLIIKSEAAVLRVENNIVSKDILIKNTNNSLVIETLNNVVIKKVLVFNLLGKELFVKENNSSVIELQSTSLKPNSILIVKTFLETGEVLVHKVYKN